MIYVQNNLWVFSSGDEFYRDSIQRHDEHSNLSVNTSIFPCIHPWSFDRKLLTWLDSALKRINNNPNSANSCWCFLFKIPIVLLCVWPTRMICPSLSLSSLTRYSSPLCWGSENGTHSLSPCVASSLLYLLELSLPSHPSLLLAAAEFKVVQVAHPLAPVQMGSCCWPPKNVTKTVWRQWLWQVAEGHSRVAVNPLVVGRIKLLADRWINFPKITTNWAESILWLPTTMSVW